MAMTGVQGPLVAFGPLAGLTSSIGGGEQLAGPSLFYHGAGIPDPRFFFSKDQAGGFKGVAPSILAQDTYRSAVGTPAAHLTNNIAAAHTVVSGTPMTLAAPSFGASTNIPIVPIGASSNTPGGNAIVTPGICLDFGFGLATLVSGSANVTFADTSVLLPGMPLIFAAIATTTTPWLTTVQSITSATVAVMATTAPFSAASGGARVGTGNIWQPNEGSFALPTAALPYVASGPGLLLDPRQTIARGIVITASSASGTGGAITVKGYDIFGQPMTETITSVPGTAVSTYGVKAWKYISSVTPAFTDATYTYAVGTSDIFGFATKATQIENTEIWWNGTLNTASTGFVAGLAAGTASTATTADVRGTILVSNVGGTGIGTTVSNGGHTGTAFTGVILSMAVRNAVQDVLFATAANGSTLMGNTQF